MASRPFADVVTHLRRRLLHPLPGTDAHLTMAPAYRAEPDRLRIDAKPCRQAAVLALLFPLASETAVLLTERRADLSAHAGQLSFPGGRREPNEPLEHTALRETHEEIGLDPANVDWLGPLSPLYIQVSNYCVYPFVGALPAAPDALEVQSGEVVRVHTVSLGDLLLPDTRRVEPRVLYGANVDVPVYLLNGITIWGATAMMLAELLAVSDPSGG